MTVIAFAWAIAIIPTHFAGAQSAQLQATQSHHYHQRVLPYETPQLSWGEPSRSTIHQLQIEPRNRLDGFLVLGVAQLPEFEGASDDRVAPFIVSRLGSPGRPTLEVTGLAARLDLLTDPTWRAGPAFGVTLPRLNDADSDIAALLPERDLALEAGLFFGFERPTYVLPESKLTGTLSVLHDVSGIHNGLQATARLEHFAALNRMFRLGVGAGTTFSSGEYFDTYFGVTEASSLTSGLPIFDPNAGFKDIQLDVFGILSFSERYGIFGRFGYSRLIGDAADSPIVRQAGNADQIFLGTGLFWNF